MDSESIKTILTDDPFVTAAGATEVSPLDVFARNFARSPAGVRVFNTAKTGEPGDHWIAVASDGERVSYFDSYGRHPGFYPEAHEAVASRFPPDRVSWNSRSLQHPLATTCGDYCLLFCRLWSRGWSLERVVSTLAKIEGAESRDHAVRSLILRLHGNIITDSLRGLALEGRDGVHAPGAKSLVDRLGITGLNDLRRESFV